MAGTNAVFTFKGAGEAGADSFVYENTDAFPECAATSLREAHEQALSSTRDATAALSIIGRTADAFIEERLSERGLVSDWRNTRATNFRYEVAAAGDDLQVAVLKPEILESDPVPENNFPNWRQVFSGTPAELEHFARVENRAMDLLENGPERTSGVWMSEVFKSAEAVFTPGAVAPVDPAIQAVALLSNIEIGEISMAELPSFMVRFTVSAEDVRAAARRDDRELASYDPELWTALGSHEVRLLEAEALLHTLQTGDVTIEELPAYMDHFGISNFYLRAAAQGAEQPLESYHSDLGSTLTRFEEIYAEGGSRPGPTIVIDDSTFKTLAGIIDGSLVANRELVEKLGLTPEDGVESTLSMLRFSNGTITDLTEAMELFGFGPAEVRAAIENCDFATTADEVHPELELFLRKLEAQS